MKFKDQILIKEYPKDQFLVRLFSQYALIIFRNIVKHVDVFLLAGETTIHDLSMV